MSGWQQAEGHLHRALAARKQNGLRFCWQTMFSVFGGFAASSNLLQVLLRSCEEAPPLNRLAASRYMI